MKKTAGKRVGLSLIEMVVAVMVIIIVGIVIVPSLLKHINDSRVATSLEDIVNIRTAVVSGATLGKLNDNDGDGDYLDDLIQQGLLDKEPVVIPGAAYNVLKSASDGGTTIYYLEIECSSDVCDQTVQELDQKVDGGDGPTQGNIQWTIS